MLEGFEPARSPFTSAVVNSPERGLSQCKNNSSDYPPRLRSTRQAPPARWMSLQSLSASTRVSAPTRT